MRLMGFVDTDWRNLDPLEIERENGLVVKHVNCFANMNSIKVWQ